jgi:hypothetical protein
MVGKVDHHVDGLTEAADLFRFLVIVLISRFALVGSDDRAHGVQSITAIAARIASWLAQRLHAQSVFRIVSGPGRNIELEPMQGRPRGSEGAPRESAFRSLSLNIRFFARKM